MNLLALSIIQAMFVLIRAVIWLAILIMLLGLLIAVGHAQAPGTFRLDLRAFDGGVLVSGVTPDGKPFSGSVTAHPLNGGWDATLRYQDSRERQCNAVVAPFKGQISVTCR